MTPAKAERVLTVSFRRDGCLCAVIDERPDLACVVRTFRGISKQLRATFSTCAPPIKLP
jgi:hypothetical protein